MASTAATEKINEQKIIKEHLKIKESESITVNNSTDAPSTPLLLHHHYAAAPHDKNLPLRYNNININISSSSSRTDNQPNFLFENFPEIKYGLIYGSRSFPLEFMSTTPCRVPNEPSRLLDIMLVLPDKPTVNFDPSNAAAAADATVQQLPHFSQWDLFDPVTRTAAEFHLANRLRFPSHYKPNLRLYNGMEIGSLQRSRKCPILYFPMVQLEAALPRQDEAVRSLWCKYGVVSEADLFMDLENWTSFHLAARLQKAFLTFNSRSSSFSFSSRPNSTSSNDELTPHLPPHSLEKSLHINRLAALKTALLLLPQKFTLAELLSTVVSLSYSGDIRYPWIENQTKIAKIVESQVFALSDIYLSLLLSKSAEITDRKNCHNVSSSSSSESSSSSSSATTESTCDGEDAQLQMKTSLPKDLIRLLQIGDGQIGGGSNRSGAAASASAAADDDMLFVMNEIMKKTAGYHQETARKATEQIMMDVGCTTAAAVGEEASVEGDLVAIDVDERLEWWKCPYLITRDMRDLKTHLLSKQIVFEQNKDKQMTTELFASLPHSLKILSEDYSSNVRLRRLISPISLMSNKRLNTPLGAPFTSDKASIESALHVLNRWSSVACGKKSLRSLGLLKCMNYAAKKVFKRILQLNPLSAVAAAAAAAAGVGRGRKLSLKF